MDNNINLIDQRLAQLRALIPQSSAHSAAAATRLANEIINKELKRIKTIQALDKNLGKLQALILIYKARYSAHDVCLPIK